MAKLQRGTPRRPGVAAIHPLFIAAYPVLFLIRHNLLIVRMRDVLPVLAGTLGTVVLVLVASRLLKGNTRRVAALLSIAAVWFFAYGHIADVLRSRVGNLPGDNAHFYLFPAWTVIAIVLVVLVVRAKDLAGLTRVLNVVGIALVVTLVATTVPLLLGDAVTSAAADAKFPRARVSAKGDERPNVYYLVFDRYAGKQTLARNHHFDNSPFYRRLRNRGFRVTTGSHSNYPNTAMSLASSLNMDYLDRISEGVDQEYRSLAPVFQAVRHNEVGRTFQDLGYRFVQIGSWWEGTRSSPIADVSYPIHKTTEFTTTFMRSTATAPLYEAGVIGPGDLEKIHHDLALRQFRALDVVTTWDGPKFVFAHVLLPHPPYVFDDEGNRVSGRPRGYDRKRRAYIEQLEYTNKRITETVDGIVRRDPSAVVILQADEGPHPTYWSLGVLDWSKATWRDYMTKFNILNAYRFPGHRSAPYQSISPVNTFRLFFHEYFGAELDLLDDKNYVSPKGAPFRFTEVTDEVEAGPPENAPPSTPAPSPSPDVASTPGPSR